MTGESFSRREKVDNQPVVILGAPIMALKLATRDMILSSFPGFG